MSASATPRQADILAFITSTILSRGWPPTMREIGKAIGVASPSGVRDHLVALVHKGLLLRAPAGQCGMCPADILERFRRLDKEEAARQKESRCSICGAAAVAGEKEIFYCAPCWPLRASEARRKYYQNLGNAHPLSIDRIVAAATGLSPAPKEKPRP